MAILYDAYGNVILGRTDQVNGGVLVDTRVLSNVLGALNAEVIMDIMGMATCVFDLRSAAANMSVIFEYTVDGVNYYPLNCFDRQTSMRVTTIVTTTTYGASYMASCAGFKRVRARISAYTSGNVTVAARATVAGMTMLPIAVSQKPLPFATLGHYRVSMRFVLVPTQAANSRLFQVRNTGTNLMVPTRLNLRWLQLAAHTAAIEDSLDCFKLTGFSVVDTTNTVTPTLSRKMTNTMAAAPGNLAVRHVTVAGAAAGMTGGTLTKDGSPFAQLPKWLLLVQPTAGDVPFSLLDALDDVNGTHPFAFANNEGLGIENRVLLGAAAGSGVYVDLSIAEVVDI